MRKVILGARKEMTEHHIKEQLMVLLRSWESSFPLAPVNCSKNEVAKGQETAGRFPPLEMKEPLLLRRRRKTHLLVGNRDGSLYCLVGQAYEEFAPRAQFTIGDLALQHVRELRRMRAQRVKGTSTFQSINYSTWGNNNVVG